MIAERGKRPGGGKELQEIDTQTDTVNRGRDDCRERKTTRWRKRAKKISIKSLFLLFLITVK
jgi:hypothetical protein